jgi:hypothetical protein
MFFESRFRMLALLEADWFFAKTVGLSSTVIQLRENFLLIGFFGQSKFNLKYSNNCDRILPKILLYV